MDAVSILNPSAYRSEQSMGGNSAQAQIPLGPYRMDALITINVTGSARYKGPTANAGITVTIKVGGKTAAVDDSFEGESSSITFRASASHSALLKRGESVTIEGRTDPYGSSAAANTNAKVTLTCFALAVQPEGGVFS